MLSSPQPRSPTMSLRSLLRMSSIFFSNKQLEVTHGAELKAFAIQTEVLYFELPDQIFPSLFPRVVVNGNEDWVQD